MSTSPTRPLLDVDDVAAWLGCDDESVRVMARRGEIPCLRLRPGKRAPYKFDPDDVVAWLADRKTATALRRAG